MRTHYSNQSTLAFIRQHSDVDEIAVELSYFMWESSTAMISRLGLPTDDDVREWITVLQHRTDADSFEVQVCIADCMDYIHNTRVAFDIQRQQYLQ